MRVICKFNQNTDIPLDIRKLSFCDEDLGLDISKTYVVYALYEKYGCLWYAICDKFFRDYPSFYPYLLFDVIDGRSSRYWHITICKTDGIDSANFGWSFPEWIENEYFYNSLVNGEDKEVAIFFKYKELMDLEFPDEAIKTTAQIGDDEWLICPCCLDGWQSKNPLDALVRCANCKTVSNNPRYYNLHHRDHKDTEK